MASGDKIGQVAAYITHLTTAIPLSSLPKEMAIFWQRVFEDGDSEDFGAIEERRRQLILTHQVIEVEDMGAKYTTPVVLRRKISRIAATSLTSPFWCRALHRLAKMVQPSVAIELGTSLGISAAYIASGCPKAQFFTLEGAKSLADIAAQSLKGSHAKIVVGDIANTLPEVLEQVKSVDLVFFDANHAYRPTLDYFQMCLAKASPKAVFIFDDIYWSRGMSLAWQQIERWPGVVASLDFFSKGVILFDPALPPIHVRVKSGERILMR